MPDAYADTLAAIKFAAANISPDRTVDENDAEVRAIQNQLAPVAQLVASFTNELDDGNGYSNTTQDFVRLLIERLDAPHRQTLIIGMMFSLNIDELALVERLADTLRSTVEEMLTDEDDE